MTDRPTNQPIDRPTNQLTDQPTNGPGGPWGSSNNMETVFKMAAVVAGAVAALLRGGHHLLPPPPPLLHLPLLERGEGHACQTYVYLER